MPKESKPNQKASTAEEQFEDVESPNFFRFENIGDYVAGTLRQTTRSEQFGFGIYTLEQEDGTPVRIHGSADLDDKMALFPSGSWVRIEFVDNKKMNKGTMKVFRVQRKKTA